ncbi:hypothetical protein JCM19992_02890 [Thermostilla marina]
MRRSSTRPKKKRAKVPAKRTWRQWYASIRNSFLVVGVAMVPLLFIGMLAIARENRWSGNLLNSRDGGIGFRDPTGGAGAVTYKGDGKADFGEVSVESFDPAAGITTRTSFRLTGKTVFEDRLSFDEFARQYGQTIRELAGVTVRTSPPAEVFDSEYLGRKIRARVNRTLGQPALESVTLEDLTVCERNREGEYVTLKPNMEPDIPAPPEPPPAPLPPSDEWRP